MEIFRNLTVVLAITTLVACNDVTIEGSWVEPVPGISNLKQGFTLEANGSASSINMATLKYEKCYKHRQPPKYILYRYTNSRAIDSGQFDSQKRRVGFEVFQDE